MASEFDCTRVKAFHYSSWCLILEADVNRYFGHQLSVTLLLCRSTAVGKWSVLFIVFFLSPSTFSLLAPLIVSQPLLV